MCLHALHSISPYTRSQTPLQQGLLKSIPNIQNLTKNIRKTLYFNKTIYKNQKKEIKNNIFLIIFN